MGAKMTAKKYNKYSRTDWNSINVQILEWCATMKLLQHWNTFVPLLDSTGDLPIVEETNKYNDKFHGSFIEKNVWEFIKVTGEH